MPVVPFTQRDNFGLPDPSPTHLLMAVGAMTMQQLTSETGAISRYGRPGDAPNVEQLKTAKLSHAEEA